MPCFASSRIWRQKHQLLRARQSGGGSSSSTNFRIGRKTARDFDQPNLTHRQRAERLVALRAEPEPLDQMIAFSTSLRSSRRTEGRPESAPRKVEHLAG